MRKLIVLSAGVVVVLISYLQITAGAVTDHPNYAVFEWQDTSHDFGTIALNEPVSHEFVFTNTGDVPLIIVSAKASCGCTVADYTKEPIAPGAQGRVAASYNAAKSGVFNKTVTVQANTEEGQVTLTLKGEVAAE